MADILTRGRMVFGVGRGTVPREAETLGGVVASGDNAMGVEQDRLNRELFEEAMEVIRTAWGNETFSYTGKHFVFPPPGIPDRGSTVQDLTLIPKPRNFPELPPIYQPATSPATIDYVAPATSGSSPRARSSGSPRAGISSPRRRPATAASWRRGRGGRIHQHPRRPHDRGGDRQRPQRPRRVREVPLALRPLRPLPG